MQPLCNLKLFSQGCQYEKLIKTLTKFLILKFGCIAIILINTGYLLLPVYMFYIDIWRSYVFFDFVKHLMQLNVFLSTRSIGILVSWSGFELADSNREYSFKVDTFDGYCISFICTVNSRFPTWLETSV